MSVTALVTGRLIGDPESRVGGSGKPFVLAKIGANTEDGDSLVSVIAFGSLANQLRELGKGDTVSISGRAKVVTWVGRDNATKAGLSLTADVLLTAITSAASARRCDRLTVTNRQMTKTRQ